MGPDQKRSGGTSAVSLRRSDFPTGVPMSDIRRLYERMALSKSHQARLGHEGVPKSDAICLQHVCGGVPKRRNRRGYQSSSLLTAHPRAEGVPESEVSGASLPDEPENGLYSLLFNGQAFRTSRLKRAYGRRGVPKSDTFQGLRPGVGYQSPNLQLPSESQPWLEEYPINTWTNGKTTHPLA